MREGFRTTLLIAALLLCTPSMAAPAEGPNAPCGGEVPAPAYAPAGQEPNVTLWTSAELGAPWTPPSCTGWSAKSGGVLAAISGRFRYKGSAGDLLARFGAISALAGVKYWSVTENGWRTLITSATALDDADPVHTRQDFAAAELRSGGDLYFAQSDNRASGEVVYRLRVRDVSADGFTVAVENVTAVRRLMLTLFDAGDLQSVHFLARQGPNEWAYYGLAWAGEGVASRLGVSEASYANRATALYRHFTGQDRR